MKLDPKLLRACAAYLAHVDAYSLDSNDQVRAAAARTQLALLRKDARWALQRRGALLGGSERRDAYEHADNQNVCDELTHAHLEAIRRHARRALTARKSCVARAILDASENMLAWWCEEGLA